MRMVYSVLEYRTRVFGQCLRYPIMQC